MLEVVEHEEQAVLLAEELRQMLVQREGDRVSDAKIVGDSHQYEAGVADGGQRYEEDAVFEMFEQRYPRLRKRGGSCRCRASL